MKKISHRIIIDSEIQIQWEVKDVRDFNLSGKPDKEIISFVKERKAVLFSGDRDF